jgi:hypothetical protein
MSSDLCDLVHSLEEGAAATFPSEAPACAESDAVHAQQIAWKDIIMTGLRSLSEAELDLVSGGV